MCSRNRRHAQIIKKIRFRLFPYLALPEGHLRREDFLEFLWLTDPDGFRELAAGPGRLAEKMIMDQPLRRDYKQFLSWALNAVRAGSKQRADSAAQQDGGQVGRDVEPHDLTPAPPG